MNILNTQELLPKRQPRQNYYCHYVSDNTPNITRNAIALEQANSKFSPIIGSMHNGALREVPIVPINDVKKNNSRSIFNRSHSLTHNLRADRGFLNMLERINQDNC